MGLLSTIGKAALAVGVVIIMLSVVLFITAMSLSGVWWGFLLFPVLVALAYQAFVFGAAVSIGGLLAWLIGTALKI